MVNYDEYKIAFQFKCALAYAVHLKSSALCMRFSVQNASASVLMRFKN